MFCLITVTLSEMVQYIGSLRTLSGENVAITCKEILFNLNKLHGLSFVAMIKSRAILQKHESQDCI